MHYKFPEIRTIDDVLPAIEGYEEFIVAKRGFFNVINYVNLTSDTFRPPIVDTKDGMFLYPLMETLRRECRGLIFDGKTGQIIRRPFHKFFNLGERMETLIQHVDFSSIRYLQYKLDGSMIAPFVTSDNVFRIGTKMGETEIADQVKQFVDNEWIENCRGAICDGYTPIFEWMSPWNTVVIRHSTPRLRLIGLRNMISGNYAPIENNTYGFDDIVDVYSNTVEDVENMVSDVRGLIEEEGIVAVWDDGSRVKLKGEWYCAIHKVKDNMLYERNVLSLVLSNGVDDVIPFVDSTDRIRLENYQRAVNHWIYDEAEYLFFHIYGALVKEGLDKKTFAVERSKKLGAFSGIGFRAYDDQIHEKLKSQKEWVDYMRVAITGMLEKACHSNIKLAEFKKRANAENEFVW